MLCGEIIATFLSISSLAQTRNGALTSKSGSVALVASRNLVEKGIDQRWVNYQAFRAQQEGKLIAVSFDPIKADELPGWLTDQQITSLRGWQNDEKLHDGWLSVSRAVHAKCGKLPDYKFKGWLATPVPRMSASHP